MVRVADLSGSTKKAYPKQSASMQKQHARFRKKSHYKSALAPSFQTPVQKLNLERHFQVFCRIPDTWAPLLPFARMPEIGQRHFRGRLGNLIPGFPIIIRCLGARP